MSLATSSRSRPGRARQARPGQRQASSRRANPLYQDIIVFQDDSASSDGNVTGIVLGLLAAYPMTVYAEALPATWLALQEKADAEASALERRVASRIEKTLFPSEIRRINVMGGEAGETLAMHARYADLAVIGLPRQRGRGLEERLFEGALFGSGRPVIAVPEGYAPQKVPRRILVGWRPTREAARAVHDAMPILEAAETVRVVTIDERSTLPEGEDPGADIARHLARHDINVDVKNLPYAGRGIAERLVEEARYIDADLIVLGGYGHSRMREWLLGGVTRDILALAERPVLFSH
jgi:nucleotide-binding universal stress UspA family protein